MAAPRVSVICPFYNAERFLGDAIESVLAQGFADWELVLVDDGSRDGGAAIAERLVSENRGRMSLFRHAGGANMGTAASRNLGLSAARGQLLAFIDADDVWQPYKLAEQVAFMDAHPDVAMLCGAIEYWRSWDGGTDEVLPTGPGGDVTCDPPGTILRIYPLALAHAPCPTDVMVRHEAVEALGGFEESFTGDAFLYEDQAFFAKFYLSRKVHFSDRNWIRYRQHGDSCVAVSMSAGHYHAARAHYLAWLQAHVRQAGIELTPEIERAIARASWRVKRPLVNRILNKLRIP